MTLTQSTKAWKGRDSWEAGVVSAIGDFGTLAERPWSDIREIEFLPNVRVGSALYVVPELWLPHGGLRRLSSRTIDPFISTELDETIRRSLFALALPRQTRTGIRRFKPTSWLSCARKTLRMAQWVANNHPSKNGRFWSNLSVNDWQTIFVGVSDSEEVRTTFASIIHMLEGLGRRGVISDFPVLGSRAPTVSLNNIELNEAFEASRRGLPVKAPKVRQEYTSFQPLPDVFVSQIVTRARWLQENLSDQLLDCWALMRTASERAADLGRRQSHPSTTLERRRIIGQIAWKDGLGRPLTRLPWPISVKESKAVVTTDIWPPKDPVGINMMVGTLQALNFCTVALCTGARSHEILSATDRSLRDDDDARLHARTWKLVDELGGEERDWPLHPVAVKALEIQQRIASIIRSGEDDHLWVLLANGSEPAGSPLRNVTEPLVNAAEKLGLEEAAGESRPHAHRWRHTVGRLVALSVTSAPQVLMDLFGHRDLEMTLRYMLASPQMAEEVMRIAAEVSRALATEAIADADAGAAGGPAAEALEKGIEEFRMRRGEEEFDAQSIRELGEILTFNDRFWQVVRPGVVCTKTLGQFGPCTMGRGDPDPGACRTTCEHRLETARAKSHCEGALGFLLEEHETALAQGEEMIVASLEGQILATLARWDDVRERAVAHSATAHRIWEERVNA